LKNNKIPDLQITVLAPSEDSIILKNMVRECCERYAGPMGDLSVDGNDKRGSMRLIDNKTKKKRRLQTREEFCIVKDLILALTLCHNVTPVYHAQPDRPKKELQASSPDEVALV
jgi:magnesium-transporting ATPase (P-type)